ncbi:MAG: UDP-N-acetylmuramoyl-L-alanyl-D-glutamate--2,6-diaminopimelate ligase [bacterium]
MNLAELLNSARILQVVGNAELKEVTTITFDSRSVAKETIFVAVKGFKIDGHEFILDAINSGAAAVILENANAVPDEIFRHSGCVKIIVKNSRKALAEFSHLLFDEPSLKMKMFGITGTKGKTTTTYFLKNICETAGIKTGLIGTITNFIGNKYVTSRLTTPESNEINGYLKDMVDSGCLYCVMEVSSHSLELNRVDYLDFDFAALTNFTSDHLDFHATSENYRNAKKKLFDGLKPSAIAVYNNDDENSRAILRDTKAKIFSFGMKDGSTFLISDVEYDLDGTSFKIKYENNDFAITTPLIGGFNACNATCAFALAVLAGIEPAKVITGIATTPQIAGRFEVIRSGDKRVIVDFSHTADSLKQALLSINHIVKKGRPIITVFGCGGDRDKTKRPIMGGIACELSDKVIVTSDNPRTEDPFKIIDDILKGIKTENYEVVENREEAIKRAICESPSDAVILLAGKGHENYQLIKGVKNHFSDKETAEKYLTICRN